MTDTRKPILHGRDHSPGGADPITFPPAGAIDTANPGLSSVLTDLGADNLWKFDEASGSTAHDSLGTNPLGGAGGTITWGGPASPPGTASVLSNATRWTASGMPRMSNNFSAGVWVRNHTPTSAQAVMGQAQPLRNIGGASTGWEIYLGAASGGKPGVAIGNGAGGSSAALLLANAGLAVDAWTLIGFSVASNVWTMYVNGVAQAAPVTFALSTYSLADFFFGADGGTAIILYNGYLSWGFVNQASPFSADDWAAIYAGSFPFKADGDVLTADGSGSTLWRAAAGTGGIGVTFTGAEMVIDGSAVTGTGVPLSVYVNGA